MITKTELDRITGLLRAGQNKAALKLCKVGMKRQPKEPAFAHLAGTALSAADNPREGAQYFMKALKLAPGNRASQDNLVSALVQSDQFDKARPIVKKFLNERGADPYLLYQLGALEFQSIHAEAAEEALTASIDLLKGSKTPQSLNLLRRALTLRGKHFQLTWDNTSAKEDFEAALEIAPNDPSTMAKLAWCLGIQLKNDDAISLLEHALSIAPNNLEVLMQYAMQLNETSRRSDAVSVLKRLIEMEPMHAGAYLQLVEAEGSDHAEQRQKQLKQTFQKLTKGSYEQGQIAFAMAKNNTKLGQRDEANKWYATANKIVADVRPHSFASADKKFKTIQEIFPKSHGHTSRTISDGPVPIFVVGQPRSGTTLTEMILSSHPLIAGVGEQTIGGMKSLPYLKGEKEYGPEAAEMFAREYRDELPDLPSGATRFVDKMPNNYAHLGFLLTAFPNAVILNIVRDPRDVAWSMWRVHFPALGLNYTFDMEAMAIEANRYRRYIDYWKSVFPGQIHDVHYEELVADLEPQTQRLATLCGVDWVPEMASPERNKAPVRTASIHQVRQKVSTSSIGGWRSDEKAFEPFLNALDPELWPNILPAAPSPASTADVAARDAT